MDMKLFGEKLAVYATREPKHFLQLDANYMPEGGHSLVDADEDGDAIIAEGTVELMIGATVRVLIPADSDAKVVVRQLKKIAKWVKHSPDLLKFAQPRQDQNSSDLNELPF